ncbi:MAG: exo-alpha-sialidase, partial [Chloroflexi bacterium]|nr:exo-alpha-sialidase [Chloroflexota bacterium]
YPETGQCVHKFAAAAGEPETLYQQNHCGMYRSDDAGRAWTELKGGLPSTFGFPLVTHPRDPATAWIIPLNGDDKGRFMPDAQAAVWRTHDRGTTWIRADDGLPQENAYLSVLREALTRDTLDPVGITFGTSTGQLWQSVDEGSSWRRIVDTLPPIWAVETVVLDA